MSKQQDFQPPSFVPYVDLVSNHNLVFINKKFSFNIKAQLTITWCGISY